MNILLSSRFLYEATNQRWSSFLREAIGLVILFNNYLSH